MQTSEEKKINGELRKLGFGSLEDRGLVPAIAWHIKTHEQFRGQLFSVTPDKRKIAYETLAPLLRFKAKPLEDYLIEMKVMAEQQQWPTYNPETHQMEPFKVGEIGEKPRLEEIAQKAIETADVELKTLYLVCIKCTKMAEFAAPTRTEAEKLAKDKGWAASWDGKSHCKRCAKKFLIN